MKKLIIILIAAVSFNAASAQSFNGSYKKQGRKEVIQTSSNYNYNNQSRSNDYAYNNNRAQNVDRNRQPDYDRINIQFDQKINGYKNDRLISSRERGRRINEAQQER